MAVSLTNWSTTRHSTSHTAASQCQHSAWRDFFNTVWHINVVAVCVAGQDMNCKMVTGNTQKCHYMGDIATSSCVGGQEVSCWTACGEEGGLQRGIWLGRWLWM